MVYSTIQHPPKSPPPPPQPLTVCIYCARIFKRLWSPGINSKELIPPAYVAWWAGARARSLISVLQKSLNVEIEIDKKSKSQARYLKIILVHNFSILVHIFLMWGLCLSVGNSLGACFIKFQLSQEISSLPPTPPPQSLKTVPPFPPPPSLIIAATLIYARESVLSLLYFYIESVKVDPLTS
jgi:hypothetical protein